MWMSMSNSSLNRLSSEPHYFPLSSQQKLWVNYGLCEQSSYGSTLAKASLLQGKLNRSALTRALLTAAERHPMMRVRFAKVGNGVVHRLEPHQKLAHSEIDLTHLPELERIPHADKLIENLVWQPGPFLEKAPFRSAVIILDQLRTILVIASDHIVCEGASQDILVKEVNALYRSYVNEIAPPLLPAAGHYWDYVKWQENWLASDKAKRHVAECDRLLSSARLPFDEDTSITTQPPRKLAIFTLMQEEIALVDTYCRAENCSRFIFFLTAYVYSIVQFTGNDSVTCTYPIALRNGSAFQHSVGYYSALSIMQVSLPQKVSFREAIKLVAMACREGYAHHSALMSWSVPLSNTLSFAYYNFDRPHWDFENVTAAEYTWNLEPSFSSKHLYLPPLLAIRPKADGTLDFCLTHVTHGLSPNPDETFVAGIEVLIKQQIST